MIVNLVCVFEQRSILSYIKSKETHALELCAGNSNEDMKVCIPPLRECLYWEAKKKKKKGSPFLPFPLGAA